MKPLAAAPRRIRQSGIRELMVLASRVPGAIHLEVGEPDFPTPPHVVEAACRALQEGYTRYAPNAGLPSLRQAIAKKARRVNGWEVSAENVMVTAGAVNAIFLAIAATVGAGEEALVPDPGWPNFEMALTALGAKAVHYPLRQEEGFVPQDFDLLERLLTDRSKALVVNSPSNPTGTVFPLETVKRLVGFARQHDLYIISDETYDQIVLEGQHHSPGALDEEGRVVGLFSFSKSYAMTGWRVGYAIASTAVVELMEVIQEPVISCVTAVSQRAAEAALAGPQDGIARMVEIYRRRRDIALAILKEHDLFAYTPHGAFYILVDISGCNQDSYGFAKELLREKEVAVAPGAAFGPEGDRYVRISFSTGEENIREGLRRLCEYISERRAR